MVSLRGVNVSCEVTSFVGSPKAKGAAGVRRDPAIMCESGTDGAWCACDQSGAELSILGFLKANVPKKGKLP